MHTVCETKVFQSAAARAGLSRAEIDAFIDELADDPALGVLIEGTGGSRSADQDSCFRVSEQSKPMTKEAFDEIAAGLNEAIAIARGEVEPARLHVPPEVDVKTIRAKTGLSQSAFARRFGFDMDQIKTWEQGRSRPLGGVRAYLMMIGVDHEAVSRIFARTRHAGADDHR